MKQRTVLVVLVAAIAIIIVSWRFSFATARGTLPQEAVPTTGQAHNDGGASQQPHTWPVYINRPSGPPRVDTGMLDELGRPVSVSCASCHANLQPNVQRRDSEDMTFHHGLAFDHGGLSCVSCHNANNYNTLRLADGSEVAYMDVHMMCAQCHAPQARDFARGVHGGMTGYWDRTRGPQVRKNCIDCHDPHAPAFPSMMPTFKPHDRFLNPPHDH